MLLLVACTGSLPENNSHEQNQNKVTAFNQTNQGGNSGQPVDESQFSFFNFEHWQDTRIVQSKRFQEIIESQLNQKSYSNDFLLASEKLVLQLCPVNKLNCQGIMHFRKFPNSGFFFDHLATNTKELGLRYHFLYLSLETQNQIPQISTVDLFIEQADAYLKVLEKADLHANFD